MTRIPAWLDEYRQLPRTIYLFAAGQFFISLITAAQFLLLNLFLKSKGLDDPAIAALSSQRFVATFFLALPVGLWLRGRPLRTPLLLASVLFPITTLAALEAVRLGMLNAASVCFLAMGFAGLLLNVGSMPMMMRLAPPERTSESLSLLFSTWAAASICGGVLSATLQGLGHIRIGPYDMPLDEHATLLLLTISAFFAPCFYLRLPDPPPRRSRLHWLHIHRHDRKKILTALIPTLSIATGAGLSIQFLNLFFSHVHAMSSAAYSAYGTISNALVLATGLLVPEIKRRFGWRGAILGVQSAAVVLLVALAITEPAQSLPWALPLAIFCFIIRQPLMSMAGPSISELTMNYVGERNRELISACNGAVWGGSWWLSARIFESMRSALMPYYVIFLITAALYLAGTFSYLILIRGVERGKPVRP